LEYVVTVDERGVKVAACVCLGLSRFGATWSWRLQLRECQNSGPVHHC